MFKLSFTLSLLLLSLLVCSLLLEQRRTSFVVVAAQMQNSYSSNFDQNLQHDQEDEMTNNGNQNDNTDSQFTQQLAESLASSAVALAASGQSALANEPKCERINFSFCSTMPYNSTRMSNFFGDKNQIEAADRAKQYEPLVRSQCNRHLLSYLCELLAPMCLDGEAMRKFEIFPCRSFCRQMRRDCEEQLIEVIRLQQQQQGLSRQLMQMASGLQLKLAFQCDQLPYESNGGEGSLRGPCHEMPEAAAGASQSAGPTAHQQPARNPKAPAHTQQGSPYWPYQPALDNNNIPPFITDTSQLDLNVLKPTATAGAPNSNPSGTKLQPPGSGGSASATSTQSVGFWAHFNGFLQALSHTLLRYSNLLSIITLFCLLVLLNAKRLDKAKRYLAKQLCPSSRKSCSSSRSSSGSSSASSQRKLASGVAAHLAQVAMSPSSSSRSLMLFAGQTGGLASHQHKLVPSSGLAAKPSLDGGRSKVAAGFHEACSSLGPSQKLLQVAANQRTLINVNGTLERLSRYQQLVDQHQQQQQQQQQQHQYDYIQYEGGLHAGRLSPLVYSQTATGQSRQAGELGGELEAVRAGSMKFKPRPHAGSKGRPSPKQQKKQQHQLYSNILLSSPSHQVLLFEQGPSAGDHLPPQPALPHHQGGVAGGPHNPTHSGQSVHCSPYASPLVSQFGGMGAGAGSSAGGPAGSFAPDHQRDQRAFSANLPRHAQLQGGAPTQLDPTNQQLLMSRPNGGALLASGHSSSSSVGSSLSTNSSSAAIVPSSPFNPQLSSRGKLNC